MNNYEISKWQYEYLGIWANNPEYAYINADKLFKAIDVEYYEIYQKFFSLYNGGVNLNFFLVFLCLFAFGRLGNQIRVLLSVCGIHSNVGLSQTQATYFLSQLNKNATSDQYIIKSLARCENSDQIPLTYFIDVVSTCPILVKQFSDLQAGLIKRFIGYGNYQIVLQRMIYFASIRRSGFIIKAPESCFAFVSRIFSGRPPPFQTDYPPLDLEKPTTMDNIVIMLRNLYGYSKRPNCSYHPSMISSKIATSSRLEESTPLSPNSTPLHRYRYKVTLTSSSQVVRQESGHTSVANNTITNTNSNLSSYHPIL